MIHAKIASSQFALRMAAWYDPPSFYKGKIILKPYSFKIVNKHNCLHSLLNEYEPTSNVSPISTKKNPIDGSRDSHAHMMFKTTNLPTTTNKLMSASSSPIHSQNIKDSPNNYESKIRNDKNEHRL